MKQFFKFMFASMAGFVLASIVVIIIGFFILAGMIASAGDKTVAIRDNSVLELKFDRPISERTSKNPLGELFEGGKGPGLNDILKNISQAKGDSKIKGILLNVDNVMAGTASLEEIRNALIDFKSSGKFICAYGENYTQGTYYLASTADKIYLHPEGFFDMRGLRAQLMFFKKTLQKLEIEPEVIRHGKFKSAVEPYINEKMSDENRLQMTELLGTVWDHYVSAVSKSRNIPADELKSIAAEMKVRTPSDAVKYKLVDGLAYYDEVLSDLRSRTGLKEKEKVRLVELKKYEKSWDEEYTGSGKKKIAVVYAAGVIGGGEGNDEVIGSDRISEALRKARLDTTVKAIVLRVNSPGGSALASDVIWREVVLAKKVKPVVVSMGDLAASGGYYISCGADKIVAEPNTITGSIGVFGLLLNAQKFLDDKLGITFDTVKTGKYSDLGSATRPMNEDEKQIIQMQVERIYDTFITHVSEGRKINKAMVDSIGQGRVWSGVDAKKLGLVDALGGINMAISEAAKLAKVEKYRVVELPEQKDFLKKLLEDYSTSSKVRFAQENLGEYYQYYHQMQSAFSQSGILARMEAEIRIY